MSTTRKLLKQITEHLEVGARVKAEVSLDMLPPALQRAFNRNVWDGLIRGTLVDVKTNGAPDDEMMWDAVVQVSVPAAAKIFLPYTIVQADNRGPSIRKPGFRGKNWRPGGQ